MFFTEVFFLNKVISSLDTKVSLNFFSSTTYISFKFPDNIKIGEWRKKRTGIRATQCTKYQHNVH